MGILHGCCVGNAMLSFSINHFLSKHRKLHVKCFVLDVTVSKLVLFGVAFATLTWGRARVLRDQYLSDLSPARPYKPINNNRLLVLVMLSNPLKPICHKLISPLSQAY
jgi:hypothetical protein